MEQQGAGVIVHPRFCSPNATDMATVKKLSTRNFDITDVNGTLLFKAEWFGLLKTKRTLSDGFGSPVLTFRQKTMTLHGRTQVFRGGSMEQRDLLYTVKKSPLFQSKTLIDVYLSHNTEEERCDFRVKEFDRGCAVYVGESDVIVAQIRNENTFKSVVFGRKDKSSVTVNPNVDYAFIASLIVILDDIYSMNN
ncbi:unnamed protein product [Arabis nemorensis]|uniref:Tubby C-terminal domain-containing protein n=1 Tax=Arabis nemorensis TaxID=586526 RepID=A0A565CGX3_9BRAS|nr:unnamed protein product [Arabis nemorensis]